MIKRSKKTIKSRKTGIMLMLLAATNLIGIGFSSWILPKQETQMEIGGIEGSVGGFSDSLTVNTISFSNIGLDGFFETATPTVVTNEFKIRIDYTIDLANIYRALGNSSIKLTFTFNSLNVTNFLNDIVRSDDTCIRTATLGNYSGIALESFNATITNPTFTFKYPNVVNNNSSTQTGVALIYFKYSGTIDNFKTDVFDKLSNQNLQINCNVEIKGGND